MNSNAMVIVLMGVCGSAKSCACVCVESRTIDEMLGKALDFTFLDADYFHPVSNKGTKTNILPISKGIPLWDKDPMPWLGKIRDTLRESIAC
ncbi:gluconokinase-like isoform X2 [Cucumis melo]|uniref:gluconokinase n=1 Tax=Cucumis melo TaxID=3656 RepID=A0A1S3CT78_CUCME|nr:gluconokinase-like isoform X2 [Cucumis melo]